MAKLEYKHAVDGTYRCATGSGGAVDVNLASGSLGAKITAVAALATGGSGILGWLSAIWSALTGTILVGSAQVAVSTFTIANGASLSGAVDLGTFRAARIGLPATITGTGPITFQVSHDNVTWKDLYDKDGLEYKIPSSAASRSYALNVSDFLSIRYLKIRTGTSASPQAQGQSTDIVVTGLA